MRTDLNPTISRHDYQPYPYHLPRVALCFELDAEQTRVLATLEFEPLDPANPPLVLDGEGLTLESISLNGETLDAGRYALSDETLTLQPPPGAFTLEIASLCQPADNSTLMGLYVSGASLFTQCEAQGFRRITWFPDRPDVMSRYTVTLRADHSRYPVLLSNGNLLGTQALEGGRHEAVWQDPHPKPCYLFALVAGDFDCREQTVRTASGRDALLQIYSDRGTRERTAWALDCLQRAVQWDASRFGLDLDLDRFMVVAARDFNMGAMENKGLNIFNSSYVLADPDTATDTGYEGIESVIGHEYFHNWTGNRVTCRDWFQLSLKEGLTVFRDQEFSADMMADGLPAAEALSARAVKRIDDVTALRVAQFPEDAGPMAHPIRPESYQEISNFYTATVYEKGAEVIRMLHTLLGEDGFQAGMREYFRRHDGQAVTCDDFVAAMDSVYRTRHPGRNLDVFRRWYEQAGTPRVRVTLEHDAARQVCRLTLAQHCDPVGIETRQEPPAPKPPLHIPFAIGMLSPDGAPLPLRHEGAEHDTVVLELTQASQSWEFPTAQAPVLSLLRNFSAPVIVEYDRTDDELMLLARHDSDPYARWEAVQELAIRHLLLGVQAIQHGGQPTLAPQLRDTWLALLQDPTLTPAYRARVLTLPAEKIVLERTSPLDPLAVARARSSLRAALGDSLAQSWRQTHARLQEAEPADFRPDAPSAGARALKNLALAYLAAGGAADAAALAWQQYQQARTLTDRMGALSALLTCPGAPEADQAMAHFYETWQQDPLVVDRWFALQATTPGTTADTVRALMLHPAFTLRNPNRARALIFQFCMNNMAGAHQPDGYAFWADQVVALDALNPEIAARLARAFDNFNRYVPANRDAARDAMLRIQRQPALSRNVAEIVSKALTL